jgi:hypothetical protein
MLKQIWGAQSIGKLLSDSACIYATPGNISLERSEQTSTVYVTHVRHDIYWSHIYKKWFQSYLAMLKQIWGAQSIRKLLSDLACTYAVARNISHEWSEQTSSVYVIQVRHDIYWPRIYNKWFQSYLAMLKQIWEAQSIRKLLSDLACIYAVARNISHERSEQTSTVYVIHVRHDIYWSHIYNKWFHSYLEMLK